MAVEEISQEGGREEAQDLPGCRHFEIFPARPAGTSRARGRRSADAVPGREACFPGHPMAGVSLYPAWFSPLSGERGESPGGAGLSALGKYSPFSPVFRPPFARAADHLPGGGTIAWGSPSRFRGYLRRRWATFRYRDTAVFVPEKSRSTSWTAKFWGSAGFRDPTGGLGGPFGSGDPGGSLSYLPDGTSGRKLVGQTK